jgi:signal transduction histidine kinase
MKRLYSIHYIFFYFVLIFASLNAISQNNAYYNYTPNNGLAEGRVQQILQDKYGRIVVRGWETISVLDGQKVKTYDSYNNNPLGFLTAMWLNNNEEAEVVGANGIVYTLHKNNITIDSTYYRWAVNQKFSIFIDAYNFGGVKFLCADSDLYTMQYNKKTAIYKYKDANNFQIFYYIKDYLLFEEGHFLKLLHVAQQKVIAELRYKDYNIVSKCTGEDNNLYLCNAKNIYQINSRDIENGKLVLKNIVANLNIPEQWRNKPTIFCGGNIYFLNSAFGIYEYSLSKSSFRTYLHSEGLVANVNNVFLDKEKNIWFISSSDGIQRMQKSPIQPLNKTVSNTTEILHTTTPNEIELASGKSLTVTDGQSKKVYTKKSVTDLTIFTWKDLFWRETSPFCYKADNGQVVDARQAAAALKLVRHPFQQTSIDKDGNLLFTGDYIILIDKRTLKHSVRKLIYYTDNIVQDEQKTYWAFSRASKVERFILQENEFETKGKSYKFYQSSIRYVRHWNKDSFLIATRTQGLFMIKMLEDSMHIIKNITTTDGLNSNFVNTIIIDKLKQIWLGTFVGVNKIQWNNGNCIVESIGKSMGIYSESKVAALVADSNKIVVSSLNGVYTIDVNKPKNQSTYLPSVFWGEIKVNGKPIDELKRSRFSNNENNFEFLCSATSFLNTESILFHYTIISDKDTTRRISNDPQYIMSNLPPGNYQVSVKVVFPNDNYDSKTLTYKFTITKPIYARWWFILLSVVFLVAAIATPIRLYFKNQLQKRDALHKQRQAVNNERNRIAADMHDDLGSGLTRINYASQRALKGEMNATELVNIQKISTDLIDSMREIIWAMKEDNNNLEELIYYIKQYANEYCAQHGLKCVVSTPNTLPQREVRGENRREIFLCIKEILHNVVKHANATTVTLQLILDQEWQVVITDDGIGIPNPIRIGNGTKNIKVRIERIGGKVSYTPIEKGTQVVLHIPL